MGQENLSPEQEDQPELDKTQPSPVDRPRSMDWRPPEYRPSGTESGAEESASDSESGPPVRHVRRSQPRRRPPTEGAPAWVVGLGVGALLAVILLLALAFVLSRPATEAQPTPTIVVVTPTETLAPRPTFTPQLQATTAVAPAEETSPAATAPPADSITVGGYVRVVAPAGLSFRESAGTGAALVQVLDNGALLEVISGPQEADGYTWWQLRKVDGGQEGWSAAGSGEDEFLAPAAAP